MLDVYDPSARIDSQHGHRDIYILAVAKRQ